MKNFNIIVIASLAFIFIIASGCSKNEEEDSPYTREQIIGKWFYKSYWIEEDGKNGYWKVEPQFGENYKQFNADGTYYTQNIKLPKNTWTLKGKNLTTMLYLNSGLDTNVFEIEELTEKTMIINRHIGGLPNISRFKLINEKYINEKN